MTSVENQELDSDREKIVRYIRSLH